MDKYAYVAQLRNKNNVYYLCYCQQSRNKSMFFDVISNREVYEKDYNIFTEIHSHEFYIIIWFFNSCGSQEIDFTEYAIEKDSIFLLTPNHLHKYIDTKNPEGVTIVFSEDFLLHLDISIQSFIKHGIFSSRAGATYCKVSDSETKNKLFRLVKSIQAELTDNIDDFGHETFLSSLLSLLLLTLKRKCLWKTDMQKESSHQEDQVYFNFSHCVEENFKKNHLVKEYASMMNISITALTTHVRKYAQNSPSEIINDRILLEAKRLLKYSSLRIKEISAELGFEDPSYFVKFFKRLTGILPTDFRESD